MAYSSLAQDADHSVAAVDNFGSASPTFAKSWFEPQIGGTIDDGSLARHNAQDSKVSKLLSSLTGSQQSYDLVEDDDYEDVQMTPIAKRKKTGRMAETFSQVAAEDAPMRTASISRQLPLNHPRPDLQSLQGAYVKNVERLEESAERLSMTSSLESELQRMKMEQRRVDRSASGSSHAESMRLRMRQISATSMSNSIVEVNATARSGGYSPSAYITSPIGSITSPNATHAAVPERRPSKTSQLSQTLPQPELEGRPLDFGINFSPVSNHAALDPTSSAPLIDRPGSAASGDTFQQANTLFNDFDGVHYKDRSSTAPRQISLNRPPRARDSRAFKEPQPGEEMIYYPAPVPVMLNLPMRLSKMNWSEREKKRLETLGGMSEDARKSAMWVANEDGTSSINRASMAKLPPQLRASAFFDHCGVQQNVQLKNGSAVATLDSILDAAAHAPVSAFTDHPIAGHLGKEVYGAIPPSRKSMQLQPEKKMKRRSSLSNLLSRRSTGNLSIQKTRQSRGPSGEQIDLDAGQQSGDELADEVARSIAPTVDELPDHDDEKGNSEHGSELEEDGRPGFFAAPTTLLAELQMRKAQQKLRNRTAADAFPNGMHSTLLELDTVTQLQQNSRKQKHVKLAWEDYEAADKMNYDDEDVPLGLLFPEKDRQEHVNLNRPIGLMERREMEENEPLSLRRARLRGEPIGPAPETRSLAMLSQAEEDRLAPFLGTSNYETTMAGDNADETLAQRVKRMKDQKEKRASGGSDFALNVSSERGIQLDHAGKTPSKTPDIEETLGQRRKRLKEEALRDSGKNEGELSASRPQLKPSRSLADLLQQNPIGYQHPNESKTALAAMQSYHPVLNRNPTFHTDQQVPSMTTAYNAMQSPFMNRIDPPSLNYPTNQYQTAMPQYMGAAMYDPMAAGYGAQMPMNMNMNMGMGMGMNPMAYPYGIVGYSQHAAAIGMGPPLDPKQRATIDRWRQGIA